MGGKPRNRKRWHFVPVLLLDNHLINSTIAGDAISRLRQDDRLTIDLASSPADALIVRDKAGIGLGVLSHASRLRAETSTGTALPASALFERRLEFGFLLKIPIVAKPMQSARLYFSSP